MRLFEAVGFEQFPVGKRIHSGAVGNDPATIHDDGPRKDLGHQLHVVGAHEHGLFEPGEQIYEFPAPARVEAGRGFVEHEHAW